MTSLGSLPFFILRELFSYLSNATLKELRTACKEWNSTITPLLAITLNFNAAKSDREAILKFYARFSRNATGLDFDSFKTGALDDNAIQKIAASCQKVRSLKICIDEDCYTASELILALSKTRIGLEHLTLSGCLTEEFLVSISPALLELESIALGYFEDDFQLEPLVDFITCPKLKVFSLWWYLIDENRILDILQEKFPSLDLINYGQYEGDPTGVDFFCVYAKTRFVKCFGIRYREQGLNMRLEFKDPVLTKPLETPIIIQLDTIDEYFYSAEGLSGFAQQFPSLKKADLTIYRSCSYHYSNIFSHLTGVEILLLELCDSVPTLALPSVQFCARVLSFKPYDPLPDQYLQWVASRFPALKELYVHQAIEDYTYLELNFSSLVQFHSAVSQPLGFWEVLVASAPNLKLIYQPNKQDCDVLGIKFPALRVLAWSGIQNQMHDLHYLTGFEFKADVTIELLKQGQSFVQQCFRQ